MEETPCRNFLRRHLTSHSRNLWHWRHLRSLSLLSSWHILIGTVVRRRPQSHLNHEREASDRRSTFFWREPECELTKPNDWPYSSVSFLQPDRIKRLLNSTGTGNQETKDKLEGMKYLLAVCAQSLFALKTLKQLSSIYWRFVSIVVADDEQGQEHVRVLPRRRQKCHCKCTTAFRGKLCACYVCFFVVVLMFRRSSRSRLKSWPTCTSSTTR